MGAGQSAQESAALLCEAGVEIRLHTCARELVLRGGPHLLDPYKAVEAGTAARFEGVAVPADITATDEDRHEVRAWLWRVLLADGTRTHTTEGRWAEALRHLKTHHGAGKRMLDGRRVVRIAEGRWSATGPASGQNRSEWGGRPVSSQRLAQSDTLQVAHMSGPLAA